MGRRRRDVETNGGSDRGCQARNRFRGKPAYSVTEARLARSQNELRLAFPMKPHRIPEHYRSSFVLEGNRSQSGRRILSLRQTRPPVDSRSRKLARSSTQGRLGDSHPAGAVRPGRPRSISPPGRLRQPTTGHLYGGRMGSPRCPAVCARILRRLLVCRAVDGCLNSQARKHLLERLGIGQDIHISALLPEKRAQNMVVKGLGHVDAPEGNAVVFRR